MDDEDTLWLIDVPVDPAAVKVLESREIPALLSASGKYTSIKLRGWTAGIVIARGQIRYARMLYPTREDAESAARVKAAELVTKG